MKKLLYLLAFLALPALAAEKIASVEHSSTSVIINFPLYDQTNPEDCPATDVTDETVGMDITIYDDVTDGQIDNFECTGAAGCGTTDTLEAITTLGTYATPSANSARFEVLAAGSCWYQLMLPNSIYATASANQIYIEITDGAAGLIIDSNYWVDLTPVSVTTMVDAIWDEDIIAAHNTANTAGDQLGAVLDAVLTDTGTTNKNLLDTIDGNTGAPILMTGIADSGSTTTIVDAENLTQVDDYYEDDYGVIVQFSSGSQLSCITAHDNGTNTITFTPALDTAVTTETYNIVGAPACLVTGARIASNAISEGKLNSGTITVSKFGMAAITSNVIATNAIGAGQIAANAIGASEIAADAIGASELADDASAEIWALSCEDQGGAYSCREVMSLLLSEAMGACVYTSGTRTWVCQDPSGAETRFTLVYGAELDGDRSSSTPAPMTP